MKVLKIAHWEFIIAFSLKFSFSERAAKYYTQINTVDLNVRGLHLNIFNLPLVKTRKFVLFWD